jgi:Cap4 dsDNA endonuclease
MIMYHAMRRCKPRLSRIELVADEAALLQLGEPPDDAGATTQSRYRYQWECTAATCIAMLASEDIVAVICEWHEDYIICYTHGRRELVSVKHREPDRGPWNLSQLCDTGGLEHLFGRWQSDDQATCRISTNAGLKPGAAEARDLADACSRARAGDVAAQTRLDDFAVIVATSVDNIRQRARSSAVGGRRRSAGRASAPAVAEQLELPIVQSDAAAALKSEVRRFLSQLQIEYGLPGRSYIHAHNIVEVLKPTLIALGRDGARAEIYYENIVTLIARANTDNDGLPQSAIGYLADPERLARDHVLRDIIGRRTISRPDVLQCLVSEDDEGMRLTTSPIAEESGIVVSEPTSRLAQKLRAGGLGPTAIRSAMRLRGTWLTAWAELRTGLPGDAAELADMKTRVLHLASAVEAEVRTEGTYGVAMNNRLSDVLRPSALGRQMPMSLDPLHILGLAYELCDECQIWFSDPFNLDSHVQVPI